VPVHRAALVAGHGIEGDAHAGSWHRQVSLLGLEEIEDFRARGADVDFGAFGENLIVEGYRLRELPVGTRFRIGGALLEMTQIGKECHTHCAIYHQVGDCIMPREGVFAEVLEGGEIAAGDAIEMIPPAEDRPYTAAWVTLSDKGAAGRRGDESGPLIGEMMTAAGYKVVEGVLLPDEPALLKAALIRLADQRQVNVIFTTGGTGFSLRDQTPEATEEVCDRMAPGIAEAIRTLGSTKTPTAALSRGLAGVSAGTVVVNLPGSTGGVKDGLSVLDGLLDHLVAQIAGGGAHE
jgi:molybdenum cofactor synthesis domain-containing protein